MARRPKTWAEKMDAPPPHIELTEKPFAGIPPGTRLLISSPKDIDAYLRRRTKPGKTLTVPELRIALARTRGAEATCPLTTAIFLRIVAENAWDALEAGATPSEVAPFWRVIEPGSTIAKKLRADSAWIAARREAELPG